LSKSVLFNSIRLNFSTKLVLSAKEIFLWKCVKIAKYEDKKPTDILWKKYFFRISTKCFLHFKKNKYWVCTFKVGYPLKIDYAAGKYVTGSEKCLTLCPSSTWKGVTYRKRDQKCYCLRRSATKNKGITDDANSAYQTCYYKGNLNKNVF